MARRITSAAAVAAVALVLSGCSTVEDIFPGLSGAEEPVYAEPIAPSPSEAAGQPTLYPEPAPMTAAPLSAAPAESAAYGQFTGTLVGQKAQGIRAELAQLASALTQRNAQFAQQRESARQDAQAYFATIAAINARLQIGTTPGNPVLLSQWTAAQSELDRVMADIAALNTLSNQVAADSSLAAYLLESIGAAYELQGALDEDHRQLALLEDETNRTVVLVDRVLNEVTETIGRFTNYVNSERYNLTTLSVAIKNGEYYGESLLNRAYQGAALSLSGGAAASGAAAPVAREALVVIRFDNPDVEYRQALYTAVAQALERRPTASFDVVAVASSLGSASEAALAANSAKRNAQDVMQALTEMGLPAHRVDLSSSASADVYSNEVRVYLR
ncbi:MAG TPA: hypothetical protein VJN41_05935 [Alphaproteobacteria bacterium]|nr:hypothetical protein [Alphaproteobacteria bacterium]